MKLAHRLLVLSSPLLAACVSTHVDVPRDHPANAAAPLSPVALIPALGTAAVGAEETAPAGHQAGPDPHGSHAHGHGHAHGDSQDRPAPAPGGPPATAASASPAPITQADKPPAEVWTCPMHPEVVKSGPGQCPICGMNLVKRAAGKAK
jgi:Heavy metal binding domain